MERRLDAPVEADGEEVDNGARGEEHVAHDPEVARHASECPHVAHHLRVHEVSLWKGQELPVPPIMRFLLSGSFHECATEMRAASEARVPAVVTRELRRTLRTAGGGSSMGLNEAE